MSIQCNFPLCGGLQVMSPHPDVGKLPMSGKSCHRNNLAHSTFGVVTEEKGQTLLWVFQSWNCITTPAIFLAVWRSAGTGWAWKQNELPAGQGWLGGVAPETAAGASPALGCSSWETSGTACREPRGGRRLCHTGMKGCLLS